MDCQQARGCFEELFDRDESRRHTPDLEEHLKTCPECQQWYALESRVVDALEQLEVFPVPPGFTAQVLDQLPDGVPKPKASAAGQTEAILDRARAAWEWIVESLSGPGRRRRLVPVMAAAAALVLIFGLLVALVGNEVTTTPGAATGSSPWAIGGGILVIAAVLVVALILRQRKG